MAIEQTAELEAILQETFDSGASDAFLIPGEPVSFRKRGTITRKDGEPLTAEQIRAIAIAAVGEETVQRIGPQEAEIRTSCVLPGVMDGRLTIARAAGQLTIAIAVCPATIMPVEKTGLPDAMVKAAESGHGLVVVAGLQGSGKMTCALALLDHLNATDPCHICTVQEPIWPHLTPKQAIVQQREVGVDVPDVVSGIRAAMRQDMDVLFVDEMKRAEEVSAVLAAADTGHMVITTAHGGSPEDVIQRFLDVYPESDLDAARRRLARVLRGVSVQRLLLKAEGKGRAAAYGVLIPDEETRTAILQGQELAARTSPPPAGSQSLADDIVRLRDEGTVDSQAASDALASLDAAP